MAPPFLPQTAYNEKHWEPQQNRAMAEAVGELAEFESKYDLSKLVSEICAELCTFESVYVGLLHAHTLQLVAM